MADDDPFQSMHLSLMQDVLPVGMAMVERIKKGGASKVVEAFTSSDDPLKALQIEGESAAENLRAELDKLSPGLGNPVVPVKVAVESTDREVTDIGDQKSLIQCLDRIELAMNELDNLLIDDSDDQPNPMSS
tara:strand:+ start:2297 stop:2692 length:396 start_codon:yes stop_codon:yes gene_type:complete